MVGLHAVLALSTFHPIAEAVGFRVGYLKKVDVF